MYKLMIVDDEAIIRDGIINNMDFDAMGGISVVGSCENGVDAFECYKEMSPDIVLTDINMPFMNGMELAERILAINPLTKVIVLTGYDKFEYARQALKLKITDFLVKPVLPRELTKVFDKVIKLIEEESTSDNDMYKLRERLAETKPILRERFYNKLIRRPFMTNELKGKLASYNIEMSAPYYQGLCLRIKHNQNDRVDHNQLDDEMTKVLGFAIHHLADLGDSLCFRTYNDAIAIIVGGGEEAEDVIETSQLLAFKIEEQAMQNLVLPIVIGIGRIVNRLEIIYESYEQAKAAIGYLAYQGSNHIISYTDVTLKRGFGDFDSTTYAKSIYKAFKSGTLEEISNVINNYYQTLVTQHIPVESSYIHTQNIVMSILLSLSDQGINHKDIFQGDMNPTTHLYEHKQLEESKKWLLSFCDKIMAYIVSEREDYQTNQASQAVAYVKAHYHESDVSLKKIFVSLCL